MAFWYPTCVVESSGLFCGRPAMAHWYQLDTKAVLERLKTDPDLGLTSTEAARRAAAHGSNELIEHGLKSPWRIVWEQLTAVMVLVLIVAATVSVFLGDYKDALAIWMIIALNVVLGFSQEYR